MPGYQDKFKYVLVPFLEKSEEMKDTAEKSIVQARERNAKFVAGCAFVGGLVGGNVGCMVGGLSCSVISFLVSLRDSPHHKILEKLNALGYGKKEQLIRKLERLLGCKGCSKKEFSEELHSAVYWKKGREQIWKLCLESL